MAKLNLLEVCAGDIESVIAAANGGADRVELCSALVEGGVTPSIGFIKQALKVEGIKVHVLIRPRGGDFLYSPEEADMMVDDVIACREAGVHGVVIGALTPDGNIDIALCERLVKAAGNINVTFHRAFDLCANPIEALDQIIALGCNRLLTSGQAASAIAGVDMLAKLVEHANGRITILAGGGVSAENAADIITKSGTNEVHASARSTIGSKMTYRKDGVSMGAPDSDEYARKVTDANIVKNIIAAIK
jgi:copper homeostasis protein